MNNKCKGYDVSHGNGNAVITVNNNDDDATLMIMKRIMIKDNNKFNNINNMDGDINDESDGDDNGTCK